HVTDAARDRNHGVLLWNHDAVLAEGAVAAKRVVAAAPELVAVALVPVASRGRPVRGLSSSRFFDPSSGNKLLPVPSTLLQVQLSKSGDFLGPRHETIGTGGDALGAGHPARLFETERLEQPRPQVIQGRFAGRFLDNRRQHVSAGRVVQEMGSRFERDWV